MVPALKEFIISQGEEVIIEKHGTDIREVPNGSQSSHITSRLPGGRGSSSLAKSAPDEPVILDRGPHLAGP